MRISTGVPTCALPICGLAASAPAGDPEQEGLRHPIDPTDRVLAGTSDQAGAQDRPGGVLAHRREVRFAVDYRRGPEAGIGGLVEPAGGSVDVSRPGPAAGDLEGGLGRARRPGREHGLTPDRTSTRLNYRHKC